MMPKVIGMTTIELPKTRQGLTIFFTGLSGAGKSTTARFLAGRIEEMTGRPVTLLDGDLVRLNLSRGLGYSREDRSMNVGRVGFVAGEIARHGGIAICALIAPYAADREATRKMIASRGGFVEVYMAASLEVCEERDAKGLYARARRGEIAGMTGIDDPYEPPEHPEIICESHEGVEECVEKILDHLSAAGYIVPGEGML